jgi:hypothetical protein
MADGDDSTDTPTLGFSGYLLPAEADTRYSERDLLSPEHPNPVHRSTGPHPYHPLPCSSLAPYPTHLASAPLTPNQIPIPS